MAAVGREDLSDLQAFSDCDKRRIDKSEARILILLHHFDGSGHICSAQSFYSDLAAPDGSHKTYLFGGA
jgi:hypothetical protein